MYDKIIAKGGTYPRRYPVSPHHKDLSEGESYRNVYIRIYIYLCKGVAVLVFFLLLKLGSALRSADVSTDTTSPG